MYARRLVQFHWSIFSNRHTNRYDAMIQTYTFYLHDSGYLFIVCETTFLLEKSYTKVLNKFPHDFVFGAASSSYQTEGAWNVDGKGESIWDRSTHDGADKITGNENADIACDSYHNYKRDVEMMRELNLDVYRLSISWTRVLPNGFDNEVNKAGIAFYNNLIDEMLKYNIQPWVTIFHWDLPQILQDLGGWTNPYIVDWFVDYAKVVFENFGDRVKSWVTINEPMQVCYLGYGSRMLAPRLNESGTADYMCYKNVILAHAKVYHLYQDMFKDKQRGKIGITAEAEYPYSESDAVADLYAVTLARDFEFGIYLEPLAFGNYPKNVQTLVDRKSKRQGLPRSRLIPFTSEEKLLVKGTLDFIGINHYTSRIAFRNATSMSMYPEGTLGNDAEYYFYSDPSLLSVTWLSFDPNSVYLTLKYFAEYYSDIDLYITENGWPLLSKGLDDDVRVDYITANLNGVLRALKEGINVKGYVSWSIMDSYEWMSGYSMRFGLYETDFESANRTRTPRKSAFVYKDILRKRYIDPAFKPNMTNMWIDNGH